MFKKILISLAFFISFISLPSFAESVENNMYKQYFIENKVDINKVVKELSRRDLDYQFKSFLLDKNNKITIEEAKEIINLIDKDEKINSQNKFRFYFRYYNFINPKIKNEFKISFKKSEVISNEALTAIEDLYEFLTPDQRKEIILSIIDNCVDCYVSTTLINKQYDKDIVEAYINKFSFIKNEHDSYKYMPQDINSYAKKVS